MKWVGSDRRTEWLTSDHTQTLCSLFHLKAVWVSSLTSWGWRKRCLEGLEWPCGTSCLIQQVIQSAFSPEGRWVSNVKLYKDIARSDTIFPPLCLSIKLFTGTVSALFINLFLLLFSRPWLTNPWLLSKSLLKPLRDGFSHCFLSLEHLLSVHEKIIIVK